MPPFLNWLGYIIGLAAGIQQLTVWLKSRRLSRAQTRAFEILNDQLDANGAREEAEKYEIRRRALRNEIEKDIPREARRVYLLNRFSRLSENIATEYREYVEVSQEIGQTETVGRLDQQIRAVIEEAILPVHRRRERRDRVLFGALAFLILLNFLPLGSLPLLFFPALTRPWDYGQVAAAIAIIAVAVMAFATVFLLQAFTRFRIPMPQTLAMRAILLFPVLIFIISSGQPLFDSWQSAHRSTYDGSDARQAYHATLPILSAIAAGAWLVEAINLLKIYMRKKVGVELTTAAGTAAHSATSPTHGSPDRQGSGNRE